MSTSVVLQCEDGRRLEYTCPPDYRGAISNGDGCLYFDSGRVQCPGKQALTQSEGIGPRNDKQADYKGTVAALVAIFLGTWLIFWAVWTLSEIRREVARK